MPKYWGGMSFEKKTITDSKGRNQDIVIAMAEDEYNDRSYRDYLETSVEKKTREEMEKKPEINRDPRKVEALRNMMREHAEYRRRQQSEHPKKYW